MKTSNITNSIVIGVLGRLELDRAAVNVGPHHSGRTQGVNTRTKRIKR
jgi:hypothetical protein